MKINAFTSYEIFVFILENVCVPSGIRSFGVFLVNNSDGIYYDSRIVVQCVDLGKLQSGRLENTNHAGRGLSPEVTL